MVVSLDQWCRYYEKCNVIGATEKNCPYGSVCEEFLQGSMPNRLLPKIVEKGYLPVGYSLMLALEKINEEDAVSGHYENREFR